MNTPDEMLKVLLAGSSVINKGLLSEEAAEKLKAYMNRLVETRSSGPAIENEGEIKSKRVEVMKRLNQLRSRAMLYVKDAALQEQIWVLLNEQTHTIYDANNRESLDEALDRATENLDQVESVIEAYEKRKIKQRLLRMLAVYLSVLILCGFVFFLWYARQTGISTNSVVELLGLPVPVILWSALGSFAAILYRFSISKGDEISNPMGWLFSRPLTGVVMGSITYLIIKVGLMTFAPGTPTGNLGTVHLMWLVAFLAGFSDRFSDSLLRSLIGRFGGDKDGDILSMEITTQNQKEGMFNSLFGALGTKRRDQAAAAGLLGAAGNGSAGNGSKANPPGATAQLAAGQGNTDKPGDGVVSGRVSEGSATTIKIEKEKSD